MKFGYYLSSEAERDIDEIITYIAQENPTAAHKFLDALMIQWKNYLKTLIWVICVKI